MTWRDRPHRYNGDFAHRDVAQCPIYHRSTTANDERVALGTDAQFTNLFTAATLTGIDVMLTASVERSACMRTDAVTIALAGAVCAHAPPMSRSWTTSEALLGPGAIGSGLGVVLINTHKTAVGFGRTAEVFYERLAGMVIVGSDRVASVRAERDQVGA